MFKVTYKDGRDGNKEKEKFFKTKAEVIGFKIVGWYEYGYYAFKVEEEEVVKDGQ